ncbi:protein phosphatase 2C domain-containing protein [Bacillus sp. JJ1127]|uniref:protein phosphatase 2C domain-containing protein n=1 Tax=Bacillus sp. JJ1127 TaxID=3122952 RepID=UPI003000703A
MKLQVVSQVEETPLQLVKNDNFICKYGYYRARESQELQESGQDFLAFHMNDSSITFAVCDGVGMSFCGELASAFIGKKLMNWLYNLKNPYESNSLQKELHELLQVWTNEGMEIVKSFQLPENTAWLLAEVLEEKRKHGSESMFICGKIELVMSENKARVLCVMHGDSSIHFLKNDKQHTEYIQKERDTHKRWSTCKGIIGEPVEILCKTVPINEVNRIIVHSDGLPILKQYEEANLKEEIARTQESPTSDDIAYFDISW